MAVPDWPGTYGYNMFLYPWATWISGPFDLFIEHGHRLLGASVGLLTIGLCLAVWNWDQRPWLRAMSLAALMLVIGQGVLGGMRVRMDEVRFAQIHGCVGPLFFSVVVALAAFTSKWWRNTKSNVLNARRFERIALLTTVLAYLQIVIGSNLRHIHPSTDHSFFKAAVVFHLLVAVVVLAQVLVLATAIWRAKPGMLLTVPTTVLAILLPTQIGFGVATWMWKYGWPFEFLSDWQPIAAWLNTAGSMSESVIVTSHVAMGSLILAMALLVLLRSARLAHLSGRVGKGMSTGMGVVA